MPNLNRTILVSNRLPVTAQASADGISFVPGIGGLASGLRTLHEQRNSVWVGWPGDLSPLPRGLRRELDRLWPENRIVPVHIRPSESRAFHDSFCNGVLWPLFHYSIDRIPTGPSEWEAYREMNARFAAAVVAQYQPGDLIWIHDFHLMLVPALVRQQLPHAAIGFFLHVPFPASDVFRVLPWRREILEGMLGASLVGFHTDTYASHFVDAVSSLSVHEVNRRVAAVGERTARIGAYPLGVDVNWFEAVGDDPALAPQANGRQLLVGVDRLDYTKGIPRRLLAYERLLASRPDLRGRVELIQVAVPSRGSVPTYQQLRREVEELVGRINGAHGTVDWTPVRYLHQCLSPEALVGLYRAADVMLVTPLRDGMNLVAKEFVASSRGRDGVLVLSEFAGASAELKEALSVNPYLIEEMTDAMARALAMKESERRRRMTALRRRVSARDRDWWADTFIRDLVSASAVRPAQRTGVTVHRVA